MRSAAQLALAVMTGAVLLSCTAAAGAELPEVPAALQGSASCYEVFVYSFYDSDGDGIGDLKGLTQKLDYINDGDAGTEEDLGCSMLWIMPVFPSPTYHKYDVTDYCSIDPQYGTLEDLDALTAACHERGIRLILDLPVNHTSSEHPWFQQACQYLSTLPEGTAPSSEDCPYINYYNFSEEAQDGYAPLEGTNLFYEARFWEGMPDLNLDNEAVREELSQITGFWLARGVDGFRLDAVTSYYTQDKEKSIAFCRWLSDTVKAQDPDAYLVGEAWTDQAAYAEYYSSGIDSMFDFAFAGAEGYIAALARGKRPASWYGTKLMEEEALYASYGEQAVNAPFYTNHDMARGAGYFTRDAANHIKLAQALNLLMPGNVFLYYGEELGMKGSGKDENKRAPMYWSEDPDAEGMCSGPPEMEEVKMTHPSLEEQAADPYSILSCVRKAIHLREKYPAIARGKTSLAQELSGKEICVLLRRAEGTEPVILVINTSAEAQQVSLEGGQLKEAFKEDPEGLALSDMLCVSEEQAVYKDGNLTIPAFAAAILTWM